MGILNRLSRGFTQADKTATRKRAAISAAKQKFTKETGAPVSNLEHGRTMWEKFRILRERREKRKERARRKKQAAKEMK